MVTTAPAPATDALLRTGDAESRVAFSRLERRYVTCGGTIYPGEHYRRDRWPELVLRRTVVSTICRRCQGEGL